MLDDVVVRASRRPARRVRQPRRRRCGGDARRRSTRRTAAIALLDDGTTCATPWREALGGWSIATSVHGLVAGRVNRLLLDAGALDARGGRAARPPALTGADRRPRARPGSTASSAARRSCSCTTTSCSRIIDELARRRRRARRSRTCCRCCAARSPRFEPRGAPPDRRRACVDLGDAARGAAGGRDDALDLDARRRRSPGRSRCWDWAVAHDGRSGMTTARSTSGRRDAADAAGGSCSAASEADGIGDGAEPRRRRRASATRRCAGSTTAERQRRAGRLGAAGRALARRHPHATSRRRSCR